MKNRLGIDKSIAYNSAGQMVSAAGGVITAIFILKCLNGVEQGYYYTFKSILAIQVFFELGMNTVITQYAAHEVPHLMWNGNRLEGEILFRSRLASLLKFCLKWYGCFSLLLLMALYIGGQAFFGHYGEENAETVTWREPWLILCITTAANLFLTPLFSFLQGLGKVEEVARYTFYKFTLYLISVLAAFSCGAGLYALSIGNVVNIAVSALFLCFTPMGRIMYGIFTTPVTVKISYLHEIFPFQWKIAVSWISGYFIFQLFNPVIFATDGAEAAGQMGMTLTVLTGIQALTLNWTSTKIPVYSGLIEKKDYKALDLLFHRTLRQATAVNAACLLMFLIGIALFRYGEINVYGVDIAARFLPLLPMVLMMVPEWINQWVTAWATYLRCHKKEPFLPYSVVTGVLCCMSTLGAGHCMGLTGVTTGYCCITIAMMPWAYNIFKTKRQQWHNN